MKIISYSTAVNTQFGQKMMLNFSRYYKKTDYFLILA